MPPSPLLRKFLSILAAVAVLMFAGVLSAEEKEPPSGIETSAKEAILVDGATGAVLFEKNADEPFPPASLAKLMTMEIVFDALKSGRLSLDQEFPVSEHAWRTGGAPSGTSTMFAEVKSSVPLRALIRGTIVQSANDAAIVIAEGMAGSEAEFAKLMNARAAELGLEGSVFANPTGLPAEGQAVTARDLVKLARHIEATYPDLYRIYSEPAFEWNDIFQRNRNPLLGMGIGATGMKTGFTDAAGYSLVGVTEKAGRKTFLAIGGLESDEERASEGRKLLEWAASAFRRKTLFEPGAVVGSAEVYGGTTASVPLVAKDAVVALVPIEAPESVTAHIIYDAPLRAPIAAGEKVAEMEIRIDGRPSVSSNLLAGRDVGQGTFASRALDAAQELAFGWIRSL